VGENFSIWVLGAFIFIFFIHAYIMALYGWFRIAIMEKGVWINGKVQGILLVWGASSFSSHFC